MVLQWKDLLQPVTRRLSSMGKGRSDVCHDHWNRASNSQWSGTTPSSVLGGRQDSSCLAPSATTASRFCWRWANLILKRIFIRIAAFRPVSWSKLSFAPRGPGSGGCPSSHARLALPSQRSRPATAASPMSTLSFASSRPPHCKVKTLSLLGNSFVWQGQKSVAEALRYAESRSSWHLRAPQCSSSRD